MPRYDAKHSLIVRELRAALGEDRVMDDPAVVECYRREAQSPSYSTPMNPEFVVFPGCVEDVQQIVTLARRYAFPYSVSSTGTLTMFCAAVKPYWCWIDPKRMNAMSIDAENMYAVVEPYVSHAQLSAEARRKGLFATVSFAGSQTSVLATTIALGTMTSTHTTGRAGRNLLGVEMVLPTGEILRTGSLAARADDHSLGEGPGPDLRGLVRSHYGHLGALGIVTKIAVKLYPWPGPAELPTKGAAPRKECLLPADNVRWHLLRYENWRDAVRAVRELCRAEVGKTVTLFAPWNISHHYACSREEYWRLWDSGWFHRVFGFCLIVSSWGVTSRHQLAYESSVIAEIASETGGVDVDKEIVDDWVRRIAARNFVDPLASRYQRFKAGVPPVFGGGVVYDSLSDSERIVPDAERITLWVLPFDYGHAAMVSSTAEPPPFERSYIHEQALKTYNGEVFMSNLRSQTVDTGVLGAPVDLVSPFYGSSLHRIVAEMKNALDPQNLANPSRMIGENALVESR